MSAPRRAIRAGAAGLGTLPAMLHGHADAAPGRPALHYLDRTFTYGTLWRRVERASAHLAATWRIRPGDRVGTLCLNHELQLVLLFACARVGAMFAPLNYRLAPAELRAIAAHAQLAVLFHDAAHEALAREAGGDCRLAPLDRLVEHPAPSGVSHAAVPDHAPLLLAYTSGTTGKPKGAVHTQAGLLANARASWWAHGMTAGDHVLSVLPLFHVGGLCIQTLPALLAGARVTLHDRFAPQAWLDAVAGARPSLSLMVPATLRAVLEHPRWADTDLAALRGVMAGSSPIPRAYIEAFHARGVPLGQVYGATETGPVSVVLKLEQAMARPGYAGWPQPEAEVRLAGADGAEVPPGAVGELWVRGANVMAGYWNPPGSGLTDNGLPGGWFHSGDLAHRDAEGCIEVVGRSKDMIISGGENIYPAEIENVLVGLPGVQECAVVGVADARWGEVPVAVIVPAPGAPPGALAAEPLRELLAARIARFKLPREVVLMDDLPRSALGKVLKPQLRAQLEARRQPG
ncbi:class I adenylate-forming enzyme family protein [Cupriavidus neocaledonicus]|uniref:Long-chain fatty acid--CoA ligase n=1 Tax=Cupriavidus neocaledonicus TaxID=1040979 RepID=A0A375HBP6_9BURK|nr:AMP-binding protein [Cupriavidus neocaledonicus]SOZ35684.1 putative O-succinylbenzoate--CoA ligase [Cupriavidus neocaledonicus]SPD47650.1 Long-chain fatty acid--CoA ligase [Cupriavidus neocaledonicus]